MKLSNIFNIDTSNGGGIKLFKKIIDRYNLGNEYKDLKTNVENCSSGGGSSKIKYYNCINANARTVAGELIKEGYIYYINVYTYDNNSNAIDTYIANFKTLEQTGLRFAVRHIAFLPISVVIEGGIRYTINSFEELLSMLDISAFLEFFKEISEEEFYKID